jgi:outer membrane protein TolC
LKHIVLLMIVGLVAAVTPLTAAPSPHPQDPQAAAQPPERTVVRLVDLVNDGLSGNLTLLTAIVDNRTVLAGEELARSIYDPALSADGDYSDDGQTLSVADSASSGDLRGAGGGVTLAGATPLSTTYAASLAANWQDQSLTELLSDGASPVTTTTTLNLSLTQPLLRGRGRAIVGAPLESARIAIDAADQRLARQVEVSIAEFETAYWTLGLAEAIEDTATRSYNRALEVLQRNQQMRELELIAEPDLITAQRAVASRATELTQATQARRDAAEALIFLVYGERADERIRQTGPRIRTDGQLPEPPAVGAYEDFGGVIDTRHDVRAARYDVDQSRVGLRVAENDTSPSLDLSGSYTATSETDGPLRVLVAGSTGLDIDGWQASAVFTYPIGNHEAVGRRAQAALAVDGSELVRSAVENAARQDVRQAGRAILAEQEALSQARLTLQYSQQQYDAGRQQLQLGLIDSFRLLQMEDDVVEAELAEIRARYSLAQAVTRYQLALGTIDDKYPAAAVVAQ